MKKTNKNIKMTAALLAALIAASLIAGCGADNKENSNPDNGKVQEETQIGNEQKETYEGGEMLAFSPADTGFPVQDSYEYPYMGMKAVLTEALLDKMEHKDVVMLSAEDYTDNGAVKYAFLKWFMLTGEQKTEQVTSFDPAAWEEGLGRIGTLGVYHKDVLGELDTLTGCTEHKELGKSADGNYTYYMSFAEGAEASLKAELANTTVTLTDMEKLDSSMNKSAFSEARVDAANVGEFKTTDVNGKEYTQDVFADYDLTLVNVFTTWCSPCVEEMPEFERFKQEMKEKGIHVVTVVYDAVTESGEKDEGAIEKAQQLQERAGLTFPMLLPDETKMNGRLAGIDGYPESFFVDKNGNIVGETYLGARSFEDWKEIAEEELANLK